MATLARERGQRIDPRPVSSAEARNGHPVRLWHWTVSHYHKLIASGVFGENDPVELIEGQLVEKMPKDPSHETTRALLVEALRALLPRGYFVDDQRPLTTRESEPEPDIYIIRGQLRDYSKRHPTAADTALVVEVANTSLDFDRTDKLRVYARSGVPAYWIVNLIDRQVEVFANPMRGRIPEYRRTTLFTEEEAVPVVIDGKRLAKLRVSDVLPAKD